MNQRLAGIHRRAGAELMPNIGCGAPQAYALITEIDRIQEGPKASDQLRLRSFAAGRAES